MNRNDFPACCGLRVVTNIAPSLWSAPLSATEQVRKELKAMFVKGGPLCSHNHRNQLVSTLIVLNKVQYDKYNQVLLDEGYILLVQFPNWNEHKQPLYLYFKEGGPMDAKPEKAPDPPAVITPSVEVKDETPKRTRTAHRRL